MEDFKMSDCWLNIDKEHGSLDTVLNMYFDENNTGANRSAKIRVSSKDGDIVKEYTIVQKKRDAVVYKNVRKSEFFTKNDCNEETEKGERLEYVVPAGKYTSLISQEDADQKALDDIEKNGQNWVNQNGECITSLWYNKEQSKEFQKNDCDPDTEEGSMVRFTIPANSYTSTISQADADQKAIDALNKGGQDYANSHGECITIKWYNVEMKQSFQKNDCLGTETGSMVEYVVPAKKYSSNISQEDADNKAKAEIEANGQDYANENGTCETNLWYNKEKRKTFTKNDCEEGYIGTEYEYIVEAGRYSSEISQEDADQKALDDIEANGQAQANLNGTCEKDPNYFVGVASKVFTRNNCDPDKYGTDVTVTQDDVTGGPFISHVSQEEANALAMAAVEAQGQDIANKKGECIDKQVFTGVYSKEFTKDNCADSGTGSKVTVTQDDVTGGPFTSTESQEAANALAQAAVEEQGQAIANTKGNCTWIGSYNKNFQKNDCEPDKVGTVVNVTQDDVEGHPFISNVSKADADQKAKDAVEAHGQEVANSVGECTDKVVYTGVFEKQFTKNNCDEGGVGSVVTVTQDDVTGGPFESEESQEAANALAQAAVEAQGQEIANTNGECTWTGKYSEDFTKNDCEEGKVGSVVNVDQDDVEGGPFTSNISQSDADSKAEAAVKEQGQEIANTTGRCDEKTIYIGKYKKDFTKNNCAEGGVGSVVTVTQDDVTGGPFESEESQAAANALAQAAVEAQGQEIANTKGNCTWTGTYSKEFQKNDCEEGQVGSMVTVTQDDVTGGPFTSTESQEAANALAQAVVEEQGQDIANQNGRCSEVITYIGKYSKQFTPQCEECHEGVPMEVNQDMVGGPFISTISQEDANNQAKEAVESGGQAYADKNGTCNPVSTDPIWVDSDPLETRCNEGKSEKKQIDSNECSPTYNQEQWVDGGDKTCQWTGVYSETFKRNDCEIPDSGTEVEVTQDMCDGAPFISFVSQDDANSLAEAAVKEQGQGIANEQGSCQFVGVYSAQFTKDNCGTCQHGIEMTVDQDMVGGPFYSLISQEDANSKAQAAVEEQGQAYANKNGDCELDSTDPQWEDTGETRCQDGVSQKEQIDKNPCSSTHDQTQWVEGGGLTCTWTGSYSKEFTKQCADGGTGSKVTVTQDDVTGGPFTSTVSQEDANSKAQAAVEAQGQAIANSKGTCEWIGQCTKQFTKNDCGTCKHGSSVSVNQDMVGGPFRSNVSKADADAKACAAVDEQGQAAANKNGSCVDDDKTPKWVDTGSTQCSGCNSQKQQRDTNRCSDTYNQTKWVSGGGKDCSKNGSWGSWSGSCSGCTYERRRTNSCGGVETDYEYNSEECGGMGSWEFKSCSGSTATYERTHSCSGRTETKTEYNDPKCCDPTYYATSEYRCDYGYSERKYQNECGDTEWRREGTACTVTYDCSNYTSSGSDQLNGIPYNWTCHGEGTQTGSGSTTSEAEANARSKCECSNYTATVNYNCTNLDDTSGNEGGCSYVCKYHGTQTGVSNTSYSTKEAAGLAAMFAASKKCQCSKTYTFNHDRAASDQECKERCPNGGTSKGTHIRTSGTGSTCSAAEQASSDNWFNELDSNYSKYCNCNSGKGLIEFTIKGEPYIYSIRDAKVQVTSTGGGGSDVTLVGSQVMGGIVGSVTVNAGGIILRSYGTAFVKQTSSDDPEHEIRINCYPASFDIESGQKIVVQVSPYGSGS